MDDVTDDISTESATVDRRDPITLPTETSPTDGTASDPENEFESDTPSMISDTDMDADDVPAQTLLAIGTISQSEATALAAAGIDTIDALATIEPIEVTAEIDLSVERLQTLSDRAAIHLVTNDASDE